MPEIPDLIQFPANSKIEPLLPVTRVEIRRGSVVILFLPSFCPYHIRDALTAGIGGLTEKVIIIEGSFGIYILEEARQ